MTAPSPTITPESALSWLQHGQSLENQGQWVAALAAYDRTITLVRRGSEGPVSDVLGQRALGVAWMNRGNALQKQGAEYGMHQRDAERGDCVRAAVAAYDDALLHFRELPTKTNPEYRNHLGAAWLNRGHALLIAADTASAAESFERAIAELESLPLSENISYRLNLSGAWTNLAQVILSDIGNSARGEAIDLSRAANAARSALGCLSGCELTYEMLAEMSLRARRALVVALGEMLHAAAAQGNAVDAIAAEAGDTIDDGLTLAREWENRGSARLRPLAIRLFRMGAQLYGMHQPHFLAEFVLENVDSENSGATFAHDAEFRAVAADALSRTLVELQRPQIVIAGTPQADRLLTTARSIRDAQSRLSA